MRFGRWQVTTLDDGLFRLDGGAMFGVVPREVWARRSPPDARNRVALQARVLLLRDGDRTALVDVGMGRHWSDVERDRFGVAASGGVAAALAEHGLAPADVTDVVLTHLHFDHAGGLVVRAPDGFGPAFPAATVHVQRRNWAWAHAPTRRDRGSYRAECWAPYREGDPRLRLLDGDGEVLPGVEVFVCDGHTVGQQLVRVPGGPDGAALLYPSDLLPTAAHLSPAWGMAYDLQPLVLLEEKEALLARAEREGEWVVFEHDADVAVGRVGRDARGRRAVVETPT